jgi:iron(III) transport system ATP-binding protein
MSDEPILAVEDILCHYGDHAVVDGLSLHMRRGAVCCLLGPSGCGKTTVLRAIAGFEPVYRGRIVLRGRPVSRPGRALPPEKRRIGMVFQDYALFPHLNLLQNVSFGLQRDNTRAHLRTAHHMLELVGLDALAKRYPHELSGGQQQRVALARALAPKPDLVLLDEPFSSLDVELRERLSLEVREILRDQGVSGLMVTHDQHEAFAMGERIGVMHRGRLMQWDTPYNLYHDPADRFVADFIGQGTMVPGVLVRREWIDTPLGMIEADRAFLWQSGTPVDLLIRPDDLVFSDSGPLRGRVIAKAFKGAETLYTVLCGKHDIRLQCLLGSHLDYRLGDTLRLRLQLDHVVAFKSDQPATPKGWQARRLRPGTETG